MRGETAAQAEFVREASLLIRTTNVRKKVTDLVICIGGQAVEGPTLQVSDISDEVDRVMARSRGRNVGHVGALVANRKKAIE